MASESETQKARASAPGTVITTSSGERITTLATTSPSGEQNVRIEGTARQYFPTDTRGGGWYSGSSSTSPQQSLQTTAAPASVTQFVKSGPPTGSSLEAAGYKTYGGPSAGDFAKGGYVIGTGYAPMFGETTKVYLPNEKKAYEINRYGQSVGAFEPDWSVEKKAEPTVSTAFNVSWSPENVKQFSLGSPLQLVTSSMQPRIGAANNTVYAPTYADFEAQRVKEIETQFSNMPMQEKLPEIVGALGQRGFEFVPGLVGLGPKPETVVAQNIYANVQAYHKAGVWGEPTAEQRAAMGQQQAVNSLFSTSSFGSAAVAGGVGMMAGSLIKGVGIPLIIGKSKLAAEVSPQIGAWAVRNPTAIKVVSGTLLVAPSAISAYSTKQAYSTAGKSEAEGTSAAITAGVGEFARTSAFMGGFEKAGTPITYEAVRIPTDKGSFRIYDELDVNKVPYLSSGAGKPLRLGAATNAEIAKVPELKNLVVGESGFLPAATPVSGRVLGSPEVMRAVGFGEQDIYKPQTLRTILGYTQGQKSAFITEKLPRSFETMKPETIENLIPKMQTTEGEFYGSGGAYSQMHPTLKTKLPADVDFMLGTSSAKKAAATSQNWLKVVSKTEKAYISPDKPTLIQVTQKGGVVRHGVDIHYAGEPNAEAIQEAGGYGFRFGGPATKIEGVNVMSLAEHGQTKGIPALTWRQGESGLFLAPEAHRAKDIFGFFAAEKTLVESAKVQGRAVPPQVEGALEQWKGFKWQGLDQPVTPGAWASFTNTPVISSSRAVIRPPSIPAFSPPSSVVVPQMSAALSVPSGSQAQMVYFSQPPSIKQPRSSPPSYKPSSPYPSSPPSSKPSSPPSSKPSSPYASFASFLPSYSSSPKSEKPSSPRSSSSYSDYFSIRLFYPPSGGPFFKLPDFPMGAEKHGRIGNMAFLRPSKYTPSLAGLFSGKTIKKPPAFLTGFDVRYPLLGLIGSRKRGKR